MRIDISSNINKYSPSTTSGPQWMRRSQTCHWKRESTEQKRRVWYLLLEWINPQKSPCCWYSPGHSLALSGFVCKVEIQGPLLQGVKCISSPCPAEVTDFRQLGLRSCCYLLLLCLWKGMGGDRRNWQSPFVLVSLCP